MQATPDHRVNDEAFRGLALALPPAASLDQSHQPGARVALNHEIARGPDDHDRHGRFRATAHRVRRDQDRPVHRHDGARGVVRAVTHRRHRYAGAADRVAHGEREIALDGQPNRDRATSLDEVAFGGRLDAVRAVALAALATGALVSAALWPRAPPPR